MADTGSRRGGGRGRGRGRAFERGGRGRDGGRGGRGRNGGRGGRGRGGRGGPMEDAQAMAKCKSIPSQFFGPGSLADTVDLSELKISGGDTDEELVFARRSSYCTSGKPVSIMTNHFLVEFDPSVVLFMYDVKFAEEARDQAKMPKRKCWAIFEALVAQHGTGALAGAHLAYDGRSTLYTAEELPGTGGRGAPPLELAVGVHGRRGPEELAVRLQLVGQRPLGEVAAFLAGGGGGGGPALLPPQDCFMALDVALRHLPSSRLTSIGASFFTNQQGLLSLPRGAELWSGWYQSLRATQAGLVLNVDTSATAFIAEQTVLQYAAHLCGCHSVDEFLGRRPNARQLRDLGDGLKGLSVAVTHRPEAAARRFRVAALGRERADQQMFPVGEDGGEKSVYQYFSERYPGLLQYPFLPCLRVGPRSKHHWLPMEVCKIPAGQRLQKLLDVHTSEIIRETAKKPYVRYAAISDAHQKAEQVMGSHPAGFGLQLTGRAVQVQARVLSVPEVGYANKKKERPLSGTWNMKGNRFLVGATLRSWSVVVLASRQQLSPDNLLVYVAAQMDMCVKSGMTVIKKVPDRPLYAEDHRMESIQKLMERANDEARTNCRSEPQFMLIIKPDQDKMDYQQIKLCSDTVLGIASQCVTLRIAGNSNPSCLANIALQINAKLGGINSKIEDPLPFFSDTHTIIFGADVNHPGAFNTSKPSIAAVTASMDEYASTHAGVCRAQSHRKEIIQDLKEMVLELLYAYRDRTQGKMPRRILFYRDGVGETQFDTVAKQEVTAIKEACNSFQSGWNPPLTFIIVQKRHHTRLFALDTADQDRSGNIPAGTLVDTGVCSPWGYDFFLCSHAGLQGTSKPTYYHVLVDESGIPANDLYNLSYRLCYLYTACTRSISAVPAVYYAHLMAFRGAFYVDETIYGSATETTASSEEGKEDEHVNWADMFRSPHPNVTRNMYFV